jgi:hypothetical protein
VKNPAREPTPSALSPRARAEEELAVALARGSLRVVAELERQAMDPKLDQAKRLRASRVLLEAAAASRRVDRARIVGREKRPRETDSRPEPAITGRAGGFRVSRSSSSCLPSRARSRPT